MAKLILSLNDSILGEYPLDKARMAIGRKSMNDIKIDNLAVSGKHAEIVQTGNDFWVEDLNSTNGTMVNGEPTKKHQLQHADVISLGKYQLRYINEALLNNIGTVNQQGNTGATGTQTASETPNALAKPDQALTKPISNTVVPKAKNDVDSVLAKIQVLNGSSSGQELTLNKALTTLGKPGVQLAVITKRPNGYYMTHVEGKTFPVVNGQSIGAQAHQLTDHDVVELAGIKMEFYLVNAAL